MRTIKLEIEIGANGRTVLFNCRVCKAEVISSNINKFGKDKRCLWCAVARDK